MKRPCLDCGTPTDATRCPAHRAQHEGAKAAARTGQHRHKYGAGYRGRAAAVRASAVVCHICNQPARPDDPWQADHLVQGGGAGGGADGPLAPAHRSCNIRRSNQRIAQLRRQHD